MEEFLHSIMYDLHSRLRAVIVLTSTCMPLHFSGNAPITLGAAAFQVFRQEPTPRYVSQNARDRGQCTGVARQAQLHLEIAHSLYSLET